MTKKQKKSLTPPEPQQTFKKKGRPRKEAKAVVI